MNGNCVLIPRVIANTIGNLDRAFVHTMGDIDYGLRARKAGFPIMVMPGYAGICMNNSIERTLIDTHSLSLYRLKKIVSPKELPPKSWYVLTSRHTGLLWPLFWVWPYFKTLFKGLFIMYQIKLLTILLQLCCSRSSGRNIQGKRLNLYQKILTFQKVHYLSFAMERGIRWKRIQLKRLAM
jgi:GT2 family glycosyltransferase